VTRRDDEDEPVAGHSAFVQPGHRAGGLDEPDVDGALAHELAHPGAVEHLQADVQLGIPPAHVADPPRQQVLGDGEAGRDGQLRRAVAAQGLGAVDEDGDLGQDARRPAADERPGRGQRRSLGRAVDQLDAQAPFQRAQPLARRRLAGAQLGRGRRQAAALLDEHQQLQRLEVRHRWHARRL
jgi:hypothetical protein